MFFKQLVREDLGCAAYAVGSVETGECAVADVRFDEADEVLAIAAEKGMRVAAIIETHNHADHVAGHLALAARTGAPIYVHEAAEVSYPHSPLRDGDEIAVGEVTLRVMHTPGHRPEHIAIAVADTSRGEDPWLVLTGDSLFIGDVARPDLAVERTQGARDLYHSLVAKLLQLPDGVEIYSGHVAGSLCGRAMNLKTSSTISYVRRHNLALQATEESVFVQDINANLPLRPLNMERIVELNRGCAIPEPSAPQILSPHAFAERARSAVVLDVRSPTEFGAGHVPGALNVDIHGAQFGTRVGFIVPSTAPILLVLPAPGDLALALEELAVVGYTRIESVLAGSMDAWRAAGLGVEVVPQQTAPALQEELTRVPLTVLDVREDSEWNEGHVPGAIHIPFHQVKQRIDDVRQPAPIAVICRTGHRSSLASSLLQRHGIKDVRNISDGMTGWPVQNAEAEVVQGEPQPV